MEKQSYVSYAKKRRCSSKRYNYRGISLMSTAAKIYNKLILNRIYDQVNSKLSLNQAGFRKRMNCTQQINTIKRIYEGAIAKNLPFVATFVDFSKAFDTINRVALWDILRFYGIPAKIIKGIKCLYDDSSSKVVIDRQFSESFKVSSGVLQGDALAPFLFIIVIDYILCKVYTKFGLRITH
jgi:hypothetical protein